MIELVALELLAHHLLNCFPVSFPEDRVDPVIITPSVAIKTPMPIAGDSESSVRGVSKISHCTAALTEQAP
jgi:hypothetical protein